MSFKFIDTFSSSSLRFLTAGFTRLGDGEAFFCWSVGLASSTRLSNKGSSLKVDIEFTSSLLFFTSFPVEAMSSETAFFFLCGDRGIFGSVPFELVLLLLLFLLELRSELARPSLFSLILLVESSASASFNKGFFFLLGDLDGDATSPEWTFPMSNSS